MTAEERKRMRRTMRRLEYILKAMYANDWPPDMALAVCKLKWPDRGFEVDESTLDTTTLAEQGFVNLYDLVDVDTGERAMVLLEEEWGIEV